jgi:N-carbamoylputrescine amidase
MRLTVCELPNHTDHFSDAWRRLIEHVNENQSDLVLLPEMPFYRWLAQTANVDASQWQRAVRAHDEWIGRLDQMAPATIVSTRPVLEDRERRNVGFVWEPGTGAVDVHAKRYLPDEPGFWEASWYQRGDGDFSIADTPRANIGFLICTELWFTQHARDYFCLSSNLAGTTSDGGDFAGVGWIVEPEEGEILGRTSAAEPFLTLDVDLAEADRAKTTYPRYVHE